MRAKSSEQRCPALCNIFVVTFFNFFYLIFSCLTAPYNNHKRKNICEKLTCSSILFTSGVDSFVGVLRASTSLIWLIHIKILANFQIY